MLKYKQPQNNSQGEKFDIQTGELVQKFIYKLILKIIEKIDFYK